MKIYIDSSLKGNAILGKKGRNIKCIKLKNFHIYAKRQLRH